jgi:BirA family transcriptional regulator, biotin operon repressor / biotin---[acetyl-CoA-carboxylase] ligase
MPLDIEKVRSHFPGRTIHWHPTIGSTMPEAVTLAEAGAPSGTVVGADEQTAGHGRYNRTWHSEKDAGLYQTVILRLPLATQALPVVTLALGLATAQAIQRVSGKACDLRWPNDVLMGGKKCSGILVQLHGAAIVAGIGINISDRAFPAELAEIATSVGPVSREDLLIALLEDIDTHCEILIEQGVDAILKMFAQASTYVANRKVIVDEEVTGTTAGLTADGFLRLRRDDGREQIIYAGGVRPVN